MESSGAGVKPGGSKFGGMATGGGVAATGMPGGGV